MDLEMFRRTSLNKHLWVGSTTYENIKHVIKDRKISVLTSEVQSPTIIDQDSQHRKIPEIKNKYLSRSNLVIGGQHTYDEFLNLGLVDRMFTTYIPIAPEVDDPVHWSGLTFKPQTWIPVRKKEIEGDVWCNDEHHFLPISFIEWVPVVPNDKNTRNIRVDTTQEEKDAIIKGERDE